MRPARWAKKNATTRTKRTGADPFVESGQRDQQRQSGRGKDDLRKHAHRQVDDDRRTDMVARAAAPLDEPSPHNFAADLGDRQQVVHRFADPPHQVQ
jgi:hypothetical protein